MLRLGRAGDRIFIQLKTDAGQDSGILFGDVDDDVECAVQYDNANKALKLTANNGDERLRLGISESVVNEDSESIDFRVEGDSNANVLFVDASTDRVGIGTNSPSTGLSVAAVLSLEPASLGAISASDSRPNLARSADGELRIAAGKDSSGFITFHVTPSGSTNVMERFKIADNITFTGRSGTSPIFSLVNVDTEDVNTGRETSIRFSGFRSGGESVDNAQISGNHSGSADDDKGGLFFYTNGGSGLGERMRITNADVIINEDHNNQDFRVESDGNANAFFIEADGEFASVGQVTYSSPGNGNNTTGWASTTAGRMWASAASDHGFNRTSDGVILSLRSGGTEEGTISVSGSSVAFNGFVGRHESSGIPTDTPVGTVVSTIDELDVYDSSSLKAGQTRANHAKVEVSNSVGDSCVYGVLAEFTEKGKAAIASVGIGSVLVTGACNKGDLLESNGDGTAKVQSDDIIRSKTIGKVTIGNSTTTVKLVSCVLYCG